MNRRKWFRCWICNFLFDVFSSSCIFSNHHLSSCIIERHRIITPTVLETRTMQSILTKFIRHWEARKRQYRMTLWPVNWKARKRQKTNNDPMTGHLNFQSLFWSRLEIFFLNIKQQTHYKSWYNVVQHTNVQINFYMNNFEWPFLSLQHSIILTLLKSQVTRVCGWILLWSEDDHIDSKWNKDPPFYMQKIHTQMVDGVYLQRIQVHISIVRNLERKIFNSSWLFNCFLKERSESSWIFNLKIRNKTKIRSTYRSHKW